MSNDVTMEQPMHNKTIGCSAFCYLLTVIICIINYIPVGGRVGGGSVVGGLGFFLSKN